MNVRVQINQNGWFFSQLARSRVFMYDNGTANVVAMKIKPSTKGETVYNAVDMADGLLLRFGDNDPVCFLEGSFVVKR